ncbi:MAG: hypothetical protein E6G39_02325 [Actinobacteria bacterium]|nr:MAG: hypothetical protein E6G39_02325 [Actinomycetota bacterium]
MASAPGRLRSYAARQLGKAVAEFRKVSGGFQRELRAALEAEPEPTPVAQVPSGLPATEEPPPEVAIDTAAADTAGDRTAAAETAAGQPAAADDVDPAP